MKFSDFALIDQGLHQSRPRLSRGHIIHAHLTYGNPGEHIEVNSHKPFPQTWRLKPTNMIMELVTQGHVDDFDAPLSILYKKKIITTAVTPGPAEI
jgi:hypothetical protein